MSGVAVVAAIAVAVFVSIPAAFAVILLFLLGFAFVWRAGYTSSVLTTWSRSRFDDGKDSTELDWMGSVGKSRSRRNNGKRT